MQECILFREGAWLSPEVWLKLGDQLVNHSCLISCIPHDHANHSSILIAGLFYSEIVENKAMEAKAIQTKVFVRFNYRISYGKAWRAKHRALERRFGSYFDAYDSVFHLLHTLQ